MTWALTWDEVTQSKVSVSARMVLARFATDQDGDAYGGGVCVPTPELVKDCSQSERKVFMSVKELLNAGLIRAAVDQRRGEKMRRRGSAPVVYDLVLSPDARKWIRSTLERGGSGGRRPRKR